MVFFRVSKYWRQGSQPLRCFCSSRQLRGGSVPSKNSDRAAKIIRHSCGLAGFLFMLLPCCMGKIFGDLVTHEDTRAVQSHLTVSSEMSITSATSRVSNCS